MVAIIVILFLAFAAAACTLYLSQRARSEANSGHDLPPLRFSGLFDDDEPGLATLSEAERRTDASNQRAKLLERAHSGDLQALFEAHANGDGKFYSEVLDALSGWASGRQENLIALVSHISKSNELRANKQLAQRLIETWKTAPDRRSTTEMIHIAALSDDADTYQQAIEATLEYWRTGKLSWFRPDELVELFVSQYWVIAPEARRGGVGFALKRRLLGVRRELATASPAR